MAQGLTNKRSIDYPAWYNEVVKKADLAENSPTRGCMIIKPYGYTIWEKMQQILDDEFKATGHLNAYFPLFIPKSFLSKEASHVEGFAKECAVVTHYRLKSSKDGTEVIVDPESKLEEELIVRPTSETIIWGAYKNWIQSYRDLPLLINQWANVVRWEMRTRLFLRTSEFLWQEGHTAHATKEEAIIEAESMLNIYTDFCENTLAMPVIKGYKTASEKFAGAEITYCIEALMQDGKALQVGTSHFLGQNFSKAFDVKFATKEGKMEYVWGTSWGVTTRLMGALIMTHSDDAGLVLPPLLAPIQAVVIPIFKEENKNEVIEYASEIASQLRNLGLRIKEDFSSTQKPGWKFAQYELQGVPLRIAVGARDIKEKTFEIAIRYNLTKINYQIQQIEQIPNLLKSIQRKMFEKAKEFRDNNITHANNFEDLAHLLKTRKGFVVAHWDGTIASEEYIKQKTKATIRCIPLDSSKVDGHCIVSRKPSKERVLIAKAY